MTENGDPPTCQGTLFISIRASADAFLRGAQVRQRYHFNSFRKGQLLRVRKYLNDVMLDQLPFLADVQRFIDELTVADVPEPTAAPATLLLEQVNMQAEL
jgi:hypothetical protein